MLRTALIEDVNRLACPEEQDRFARDVERARDSLERLRFIDTSELERFRRAGWLDRGEADLLERFLGFARERLAPIPREADPLAFTRGHPGWQAARERARELLAALDGFVELGVAGWPERHRPLGESAGRT
jgi:hypothetical protein